MTSNPYPDPGAYFIRGLQERRLPPLDCAHMKPQLVHHLAPGPQPQVPCSAPAHKDGKRRCVKLIVVTALTLLLLLLLTGILLAYYLTSRCVHGLQCGDGSCVWASQWCDGVGDCPAAQDEANCVRLRGSTFLLQIYSSETKTWRAVCSSGWTEQQGRASCREMGYDGNSDIHSDQLEADSDNGFFAVRLDSDPGGHFLRQLVLSNTCPGNTVVTLQCVGVATSLCYFSPSISFATRSCYIGDLASYKPSCSSTARYSFWTVHIDLNVLGRSHSSVPQRNTVSAANTALVIVCLPDCGRGVNSSRVSGSQLASPGSWPWHVSLQVAGSHRCGGAIISPHWIITAANCVAGPIDPGEWVVYAGIVNQLGTLFNPALPVSHVLVHEGYDGHSRRNDIALVKLTEPLDFAASKNIGAVCLPNVGLNITVPSKCWMTGFNRVGNDSNSPQLTEAQVSLADAADCGRISQDMLCARGMAAGSNACRIESGGPLVSLRDGVWWLVGNSVGSERCNWLNNTAVFGNVTYFLDWIHRQMKKHRDD